MTPSTVPKRPTNGALLPSVPSSVIERSRSPRALPIALSSASPNAEGPPSRNSNASRSAAASIAVLLLSTCPTAASSPATTARFSCSRRPCPPVRFLRKKRKRSNIAANETTESASNRYSTQVLPSSAKRTRDSTSMGGGPFSERRKNELFGEGRVADVERRAGAAAAGERSDVAGALIGLLERVGAVLVHAAA